MTLPGQHEFRQRLLECQSVDLSLRQRYQEEVRIMWEKPLSTSKRVIFYVQAIVCLAMAIGFGVMAIVAPREFPLLARVGFAAGSVFGLGFAIMAFRLARRGEMSLKRDPMRMAGLGWGFVVVMQTLFMLMSGTFPDRTIGILMVVNGLTFVLGAGFLLMRTIIEQSQLKTQEKLLEIEYRLSELADQFQVPRQNTREQ